MSEESVQLPDYLCFKPSKSKIGQNGIDSRENNNNNNNKTNQTYSFLLQVCSLHEFSNLMNH